jgi:two-component system, NarL family, nitrate/nitrite response regulator NarL
MTPGSVAGGGQLQARGSQVRILIADDHPVYRDGVANLIALRPEFELVAQLDDGRKALDEIRRLKPDVAVVDLRLPGLDGITVVEALEREGLPTKVVILSAFEDSATVYRAIASGARAYLHKVVSGDALCGTIMAVARGETVIPAALQGGLASEIRARRERADDPLLTSRELEILRLAADGLTAPEIAERLVVSVTTVKTHLQHVYSKLEVSDRTAAVAQALRRGLFT